MLKHLTFMIFFTSVLACSKATSQTEYKYHDAPSNGIVAKVGDIQITEEEFNKELEVQIYSKELEIFEMKMNHLNSLLVQKLIRLDPKSKGMTNDQYLEKYITNDVKISDSEIKVFFDQQSVPENQRKNARIKERVIQILKGQKTKEALESWLASKTNKTGVDVYFKKPSAPFFEIKVGDAPFSGGKEAKVTIVEFSDFQCPYCAKAAAVLKKVKEKYKNKIKIVFKHFPLSFHRHAKDAAYASMCAYEQSPEAFWKIHDAFFLDKVQLDVKNIVELAANKLKLKKDQFNKCLKEKKYAAFVEKDIQQGQSLGVKGTPAVYINGQVFVDTLNPEKYFERIDQELK